MDEVGSSSVWLLGKIVKQAGKDWELFLVTSVRIVAFGFMLLISLKCD